jgi:hypothetical protein
MMRNDIELVELEGLRPSSNSIEFVEGWKCFVDHVQLWFGQFEQYVSASFCMWCSCNCFQEVFGCRTLSFWDVPILEFIVGSVLGGAYSMGMCVPVKYIVHGCAVSEEDALVNIRIQSGAALSGFLECDA